MDDPVVPPPQPAVPPPPGVPAPTPPSGAPAHRDRSGWLLFFGIAEILMGAVCLLLFSLCLVVLPMALAAQPSAAQVPALALWINVGTYVAAGSFLLTMGIGTIRAKKWARALMLLTSWPVFLSFLMAGIVMMAMMPATIDAMPQTPGQPDMRGVVRVVLLLIVVGLTLIPLSFIVFYSRRNVRATFEARDPARSWVDRCPLPILGVAGAAALFGVMPLIGLARGPSFGFMGFLLTGWPAVVVLLVNVALTVWLAVQLYSMTRTGWWANVAYAVLSGLSGWITMRVVGMERLMAASGYEAQIAAQPEIMEWTTRFVGWFTPVSMFVWVLTLVWLRRYYPAGTFARADAPAAPGVAPAAN